MNIFHGKIVKNKVSKNIGILYKAKNMVNNSDLKTLYFSFVHSYLTMGKFPREESLEQN